MSRLTQAVREASDTLSFMGIDRSELHHDEKVAEFWRGVVSSAFEFGEDSVHPTLTDNLAGQFNTEGEVYA